MEWPGEGEKKCDEKEKRAQQGFEPVLLRTTSMLSPLETTYACYKYLHFLVLYSSAWSLTIGGAPSYSCECVIAPLLPNNIF